jgi:PTH1 family peptidyl-tRNA hydrolase
MIFGSNALTKASPLLVCSLGNPGSAYANTLHSAGHTVIAKIANMKGYQAFQKGMSGLVSRPNNATYSWAIHKAVYARDDAPPEEDDWTFWQSTSLMNTSGPSVKKAWGHFVKEANKEMGEPRLVVVHDELEAPLGKVSVKEGSASPRGHNGLKSCQASLGSLKWWRIGVGIGRPESRDASVVSRYVMSKMGKTEMNAMGKAGPAVVAALREISEGKR